MAGKTRRRFVEFIRVAVNRNIGENLDRTFGTRIRNRRKAVDEFIKIDLVEFILGLGIDLFDSCAGYPVVRPTTAASATTTAAPAVTGIVRKKSYRKAAP